jgi:hypothetical protein
MHRKHNHEERVLQPEGTDCVICADYWVHLAQAADPTVERFGVPNYPPTKPFDYRMG